MNHHRCPWPSPAALRQLQRRIDQRQAEQLARSAARPADGLHHAAQTDLGSPGNRAGRIGLGKAARNQHAPGVGRGGIPVPAHLPRGHSGHHLGHLGGPGWFADHRIERLDRHFIGAGHHPPRRILSIRQIEPGAFIDQPLAQLAFRRSAQCSRAGVAVQPVERDDPVSQRAGRHIGGDHVDPGDQARVSRPGAGQRRQGCDPQRAFIDPHWPRR